MRIIIERYWFGDVINVIPFGAPEETLAQLQRHMRFVVADDDGGINPQKLIQGVLGQRPATVSVALDVLQGLAMAIRLAGGTAVEVRRAIEIVIEPDNAEKPILMFPRGSGTPDAEVPIEVIPRD